MIGPIARIILRYGAGALIAHGLVSHDVGNALASDPDIEILLGGGLAAVAEGFYFLAHHLGWRK